MARMKKAHALLESRIPGLPEPKREKTRDIYDLGDRVVWVETDRVPFGNGCFPTPIPDKGRLMFSLSMVFRSLLQGIVAHDLFSNSLASLSLPPEKEGELSGRACIFRKCDPLPRTCFVAGYRTESFLERERLAGGVSEGEAAAKLAEPAAFFVPADASETPLAARARVAAEIGEDGAEEVLRLAKTLYEKGAARIEERGFILAETTFEFARLDGAIILTGETLTPGVSTYWKAEEWRPGRMPEDCVWHSFREWAKRKARGPRAPAIPGKVAQAFLNSCHETAEKLIGHRLVFSQPLQGRRLRLNKFGQAVALLGVRVFVAGMSLLPLSIGRWLGRRIGDAWWLIDRRHRLIAEQQAEQCLKMGPVATAKMIRENFRHYGMVMAEVSRLSRMRMEDIRDQVELDGFKEFVHGILAEGKGILFITGHYGNWEWMNSTATTLGLTGGSIARPLDNPGMNEYLRRIRERNGLTIIDKRGAIRKARQMLAENRAVGVLIDQDAGNHGIISPFLGRPGSTITIPVELALRTGSPMVAVTLRRGGANGKAFTMIYNREVRRPNLEADPQAETKRLIDLLNDDLSRIIMQAPEQWFWRHQRWKSMNVR